MTRPVHALFEREIASLAGMLDGRADHALSLFDDLAAEAGYVAKASGAPFCLALRAALIAFQLDFVQSRDAAVAHTAACARLQVLAMFSGGSQ